jgi:hypothetical protein
LIRWARKKQPPRSSVLREHDDLTNQRVHGVCPDMGFDPSQTWLSGAGAGFASCSMMSATGAWSRRPLS